MLNEYIKNQVPKIAAVVFVFSVTFFMYGSAKACGVLFDEMTTVNGFSGLTNGLIFTLPTATGHFTAPLSGFLTSRFRRRRINICGGLVVGFAFTCMGLFATKLYHFISLSLISGIGFGLFNFTAVLYLHEVAKEEFPHLMAIASLGSYAGVTVLPYIINLFFESYGLQAAFALYGALCLNTIPISFMNSDSALKVSSKTKTEKEHSEAVEEHDYTTRQEGLQREAEGTGPHTNIRTDLCDFMHFFERCKHLMRTARAALSKLTNNIHQHPIWQENVQFTFISPIYLYIVAASLRRISSGIWTLFLIPFVQEMGLSVDDSILAATFGGIGGIMGRLAAAASFKIPRIHPLVIAVMYSSMLALVFVLFQIYPYPAAQYACAFFSGLFMSATSAMVTGVLAMLVNEDCFKSSYAAMEVGTGICTLISGPMAGIAYDIFGSFKIAFQMNAVLSGVCAVIFFSVAVFEGVVLM